MHILITYDVSTTTRAGQARLRRIAKTCLDYGQRIQYSVFECKVDPGQYVALKSKLLEIMNPNEDSLRCYNLGNRWQMRVEHFGQKEPYDPDQPLIA